MTEDPRLSLLKPSTDSAEVPKRRWHSVDTDANCIHMQPLSALSRQKAASITQRCRCSTTGGPRIDPAASGRSLVMVAATMKAAIASSCTRGTATSRCNPRAVGVLRQLSFTHSIVQAAPPRPARRGARMLSIFLSLIHLDPECQANIFSSKNYQKE